jgi:hypothetical protein
MRFAASGSNGMYPTSSTTISGMNDSRRSSASRFPWRLASERRATHSVAVANCTRWPAKHARTETAIDFFFHQLGQHAEPDAHAQREQTLLRCPDQLPQCLLHALREHGFLQGRLSDRYVATHGGSSFDLGGSPRTLPTGADAAGGTAVTSKFYEPRTTSCWEGLLFFAFIIDAFSRVVVGPSSRRQQTAPLPPFST